MSSNHESVGSEEGLEGLLRRPKEGMAPAS